MGWADDFYIECDGMAEQDVMGGPWMPNGKFEDRCYGKTKEIVRTLAVSNEVGACRIKHSDHWMCPSCAEACDYHGAKGDPDRYKHHWIGSSSSREQWFPNAAAPAAEYCQPKRPPPKAPPPAWQYGSASSPAAGAPTEQQQTQITKAKNMSNRSTHPIPQYKSTSNQKLLARSAD
jgi:hypothetical protein